MKNLEAIEKLNEIYKIKKENNHSPPRVQEEETAAPPRVQETEAPPRVAADPRVDELIVKFNSGPAHNTRARTRSAARREIANESALNIIAKSMADAKQKQLASRKFPLKVLCELAGAVLDPETGDLLKYKHLLKSPKHQEAWSHSGANEFGRLMQGVGERIKGTDTMKAIKKATYL